MCGEGSRTKSSKTIEISNVKKINTFRFYNVTALDRTTFIVLKQNLLK